MLDILPGDCMFYVLVQNDNNSALKLQIKNKTTLFPSVLKVEGNKIFLLFGCTAHGPRHSHFLRGVLVS